MPQVSMAKKIEGLAETARLIKRARTNMRMTQTQFGSYLGRPQSIISKYERAAVEPPGAIVMHCMTIVGAGQRPEVSCADISKLVANHLASPNFALIRSALAELIESVPNIKGKKLAR